MTYLIIGDYIYRRANTIPSFEEAWERVYDQYSTLHEEIQEWADQLVIDEGLSPEDAYQRALEEAQADYEQWRYEPAVLEATGNIDGEDVHRAIELPPSVDPTTLKSIGIYWARDPVGADAYLGEQKGDVWLFRGRADSKHFNKAEMVHARMLHPNEDEVTYLKESPIFIYDVELLYSNVRPSSEWDEKIAINDWRRA